MSKADAKPDAPSDAAAERLRLGPKLDPAGPDFWDLRFREGFKPWDAGGVPAALREFLAREPAGRRVLVPGCGSGYEVRAFADAGHEVVAIDFSAAAIEAAQHVLGELGRVLVRGDFFAHSLGEYDLVYERAFLCALPRPLWPRWAARVAEVIRPGGRLAGFFYWSDDGARSAVRIEARGARVIARAGVRPDRRRFRHRLDSGVRGTRALADLAPALTVLRQLRRRTVGRCTPRSSSERTGLRSGSPLRGSGVTKLTLLMPKS